MYNDYTVCINGDPAMIFVKRVDSGLLLLHLFLGMSTGCEQVNTHDKRT